MDQGVAAIWAAGLGVAGAVGAAGLGLRGVRKMAKAQIESAQETAAAQIAAARDQAAAQVEAALAGVRAQLSGQRQESVWQIRREAYAAFLMQLETVRVGVANLYDLCGAGIAVRGGVRGRIPDMAEPQEELMESINTLWLRESALRLAVDGEEAAQAKRLRKLAQRTMVHLNALIEAVYDDGNVVPPQRRVEECMLELREGVGQWADNARQSLFAAT
ncbi:hypothetical protein ACWC5F_30525 [Streptomyces sp. NPDC001272]